MLNTRLEPDEMKQTEWGILHYMQTKHFKQVIRILEANRHVIKESSIYRLEPALTGGLLRVRERIQSAFIPIIIHRENRVSLPIVRYIHEKNVAHSG